MYIYQWKGSARKASLLKRIALSRMKESEKVRDDLLGILLLYSLPDSYENFRCALEARDELPKPEALRVKIIEESESRKSKEQRDGQNAMYANRQQKGENLNWNSNWRKSNNNDKKNELSNDRNQSKNNKQLTTCFTCGKQGHYARNCKSKKKQSACAATENESKNDDKLFNASESVNFVAKSND